MRSILVGMGRGFYVMLHPVKYFVYKRVRLCCAGWELYLVSALIVVVVAA